MRPLAHARLNAQKAIAAAVCALERYEAAVDAAAGFAKAHPTITVIQSITASHFGFTRSRMLKRDRHEPVALARNVAMLLCSELTTFGHVRIAFDFGGMEHTAINAASRSIKARAAIDPRFEYSLNILRARVRVAIEPLDVGAGKPPKPALRVRAKMGDFSKVSSGPFTEGVSRG